MIDDLVIDWAGFHESTTAGIRHQYTLNTRRPTSFLFVDRNVAFGLACKVVVTSLAKGFTFSSLLYSNLLD